MSTKAIGHEARGTLKSRHGFPYATQDRAAGVERSPTWKKEPSFNSKVKN